MESVMIRFFITGFTRSGSDDKLRLKVTKVIKNYHPAIWAYYTKQYTVPGYTYFTPGAAKKYLKTLNYPEAIQ